VGARSAGPYNERQRLATEHLEVSCAKHCHQRTGAGNMSRCSHGISVARVFYLDYMYAAAGTPFSSCAVKVSYLPEHCTALIRAARMSLESRLPSGRSEGSGVLLVSSKDR
jgi:hypothetical protein